MHIKYEIQVLKNAVYSWNKSEATQPKLGLQGKDVLVVWEVHSDVVTVLCLISISLQSRFKDIIVLNYSGFTDSENGVLWSPCV